MDISSQANRRWWDADAERYIAAHQEYLSSFHWCPEMLSEQQAQLLGDCSGKTVLEIGCGTGPCATWLAEHFPTASVLGFDISANMLAHARPNFSRLLANVHRIPLATSSVDIAFSAFGAFPFIPSLQPVLEEVRRVLVPGGRLVIAANHPMRWVFADDPGPAGLEVQHSYFEREYVEYDESGMSYAEYQHTMSEWINAITASGFGIERMIEPEWPEDLHTTWGQWSPLRGKLFPGTVIFSLSAPLLPS